MMSSVQKVLIVGGGIAGITLGLGLQKQDIDAEIVEVNSEWAIPGLGIALLGPTLRALKTVGLIDSCVRTGFGYSAIKNFNAAGALMGIVELPLLCGPAYPASVGMLRVALHKILLQAAEAAQLPIRLGRTVRAIRQVSEFAEVEFNTGTTDRFDLVVGADGAYSKIRALLFGPDTVPRATGQTIWRATVERPKDVDSLWQFFGPRHKAGFNPVSESQMYVFLVQNAPTKRASSNNLAKLMRDELGDFDGPMAAARDSIVSDDQVICRPAEALIVRPPWHQGGVTLIGDAAHTTPPHLASGAGIAIEDSIVLSELLGSGIRLSDALMQFNKRRYERCRMVVENSVQLGEWEKDPKSPRADYVKLMDESMRALAQPI
jgi:2-polyprenyl-6-methoxyphenol hydroxylase-like FAD-dependent oxidoreductase